jgi:hypothetical protein
MKKQISIIAISVLPSFNASFAQDKGENRNFKFKIIVFLPHKYTFATTPNSKTMGTVRYFIQMVQKRFKV